MKTFTLIGKQFPKWRCALEFVGKGFRAWRVAGGRERFMFGALFRDTVSCVAKLSVLAGH
jgi:hypothetical protein